MKPFRKPIAWRLLSIVLPATLAAGGCANDGDPPLTPRGDRYGRAQIEVVDRALNKRTRFDSPDVSRDANGILNVTIPVRNTSDKARDIQYRATFFDDNGHPLYNTTWFTKRLQPNIPNYVEVNSTTPKASDFQVAFRTAR